MPALENNRHEAFAQYLAQGESAENAYEKAGYLPNRHNASRLKTKEHIKQRVRELNERTARQHDITMHSLTEMYMEAAQMAREAGKSEALSKAADSLAKLHGLWVEKHETEQTNRYITDEPMQPDGWEEQYASGSDATH
jgi:phage terminase small subunit